MSWKSLKILAVLPCILIGNIVSGNDLGSLPARIKQLSWLRELYLSNCKMLRSLPELPLQVQLLDASHCEQHQSLPDLPSCLEELPISILETTSKHSLGSTHQGFSRSTMELIFTDCLKLNGEPSKNFGRFTTKNSAFGNCITETILQRGVQLFFSFPLLVEI